jgi:hypothetical protein
LVDHWASVGLDHQAADLPFDQSFSHILQRLVVRAYILVRPFPVGEADLLLVVRALVRLITGQLELRRETFLGLALDLRELGQRSLSLVVVVDFRLSQHLLNRLLVLKAPIDPSDQLRVAQELLQG